MKAEYIDHMGDDLTVVNAARVSFDKESEWDEYTITTIPPHQHRQLNERDTKLIGYLSAHNHFTPFTHAIVTVRETVPIFVARQRFKHMVGFSYNEVSRRYVDGEPDFYYPKTWRSKADNKKQGSSEKITWDTRKTTFELGSEGEYYYDEYIELCKHYYNQMILRGVAPEQARMVLPQSMYTSYYVTGSLAAWARAYNLRSSEDAQYEIRELATKWDEIIRPLFPVSWKALVGEPVSLTRTPNDVEAVAELSLT